MKEAAIEQWRNLYRAAREFYQLAPWEWLTDADVFGVQDPETGEIGYICVLGNLGEVFGLLVYLGREGYHSYLRLREADLDTFSWDVVVAQRSLSLSFGDREELTTRDRAVIRQLGLRFRGRGAWPVFRSLRPGYQPWYLDREEVRFFTLALTQVNQVARRLSDDPRLLNRGPRGYCLVRVLEDHEEHQWRDEWLPFPPPPPLPAAEPLPRGLLSRLRRAARPLGGVWEVGMFVVPVVVGDELPGHYAAAALCAYQRRGRVLGLDVKPYQERFQDLATWFTKVLEESSVGWPEEVWVRDPEVAVLLAPLLGRLGVQLVSTTELLALEEAQASLIRWLREGERG